MTVIASREQVESREPPLSSASRPVAKRGPRRWFTGRASPYLLLVPAVFGVVLVQIIPIIAGVAMSFFRLTQFTIGNWAHAPFAGFSNFSVALNFNEPIARQVLSSFLITLAYSVTVVAAAWVLGMAAAVFLSDTFKGRAWFRSLFLMPYAMPLYVGVLVWTFMFQTNGALNTLLGRDLHIVAPNTFWLAGTSAFWSMVITTVWRSWPFAFLMLLGGLQAVPDELYEAARVDGATRWQEFRRVTLPSVHNVSAVLVLVMGFWTFNDFTTPFVMFGTATPSSADLLSIQIYMYSFMDFNFGLGAAVAALMCAALIVLATVYLRVFRPTFKGNQYA